MIDETANLIPDYMREFEGTHFETRADRFEMREESRGMNKRLAHLGEGQSLVLQSLDRLDLRITRIEKRPDLVEE